MNKFRIQFSRYRRIYISTPFKEHRFQRIDFFRHVGREVVAFAGIAFEIIEFKGAILEVLVKLPFAEAQGLLEDEDIFEKLK